MNPAIYDVFIIGGGINGVGIAAETSLRGLKTMLCEKSDFGSATSSSSSKLIHGGLRYLEHYEFRLVRKALKEREVLLKKAPHIITPMTFVLPHEPHLRPYPLIRIGLWLYDYLAKRKTLPASKSIRFDHEHRFTGILKPNFIKGFTYSDCWVDDARLVILNAMLAKQHGATLLRDTQFIKAEVQQGLWHITYQDSCGIQQVVQAKYLINAAGPWVEPVSQSINHSTPKHCRLIRGSHIVVPKLFEGSESYILQNSDRRIVFAIPYQKDFTLIGTTDVEHKNSLTGVAATEEEKTYLCNVINRYFNHQIRPQDIIWSYAGIRPLFNDDEADPSKITRDYQLKREICDGAPLISVLGGKITTYRQLALEVIRKISPQFRLPKQNTSSVTLPGAFSGNLETFKQQLITEFPQLPSQMLHRYAECYGTLSFEILKDTSNTSELGIHFGSTLYEKEVHYLLECEWAKTAEDILWRRTKEGLRVTTQEVNQLETWIRQCRTGKNSI